MENYIKLLPDSIANQIAAGEVVQRPASVVKELLENAIDADATEIKLVIKKAGKSLIQVIDNGKGMSEIDARMCFERHATSKIYKSEDLFNITTLGFRGEALASIAAISYVELISSVNSNELGTKIVIEGSKVILQQPISTCKGTSISIKNIFYNVPARRNFLKSNNIENKHILEEFIRIALSYPHVSFYLTIDDKQIYHLPKTKLSYRIVHLFGKSYQNQLIQCKESTKYVKINGYIGKPEYCKKTRGDQYIFVNNRFIKNFYLNHAIKSTYKGLILENYFPFYVLFLELNTSNIDINVHPSKAEIKFENENLVYTILKSSIKKSLSNFHITPSIDFKQDINVGEIKLIENAHSNSNKKSINSNYTNFKNYDKIKEDQKNDSEKLFFSQDLLVEKPIKTENILSIEKKENYSEEAFTPKSNYKIQIHGKLILTQIKSGILLISQKYAYERIFYEKFLKDLNNNTGVSQQLLFPSKIKLSKQDYLILKDCLKEILTLGFKIELFHDNEIKIKGIPILISKSNPIAVLEGLLEQYKCNSALTLDKLENLARSLAKQTCAQEGKYLSDQEISLLIDKLFACENCNYTPDGKIIFIKISMKELLEKFN